VLVRAISFAPPATAASPVIDDVVARAQRGDEAAFQLLWERHHPQVFGMCARLLGRQADVEDAVQQTFLEAWRSLGRFEGKSKFSTWLCRIAIHSCFSLRRKVKRWWLADDDDAAQHIADTEMSHDMSPEQVAMMRQSQAALAKALPRLSERKRVVLVLLDLEGYSSPEAAEILAVPEATIRTRLFYARRELHALLQHDAAFADRWSMTPTVSTAKNQAEPS
jgi:RNA polymerase sigma-70 factor, ECF subfamily